MWRSTAFSRLGPARAPAGKVRPSQPKGECHGEGRSILERRGRGRVPARLRRREGPLARARGAPRGDALRRGPDAHRRQRRRHTDRAAPRHELHVADVAPQRRGTRRWSTGHRDRLDRRLRRQRPEFTRPRPRGRRRQHRPDPRRLGGAARAPRRSQLRRMVGRRPGDAGTRPRRLDHPARARRHPPPDPPGLPPRVRRQLCPAVAPPLEAPVRASPGRRHHQPARRQPPLLARLAAPHRLLRRRPRRHPRPAPGGARGAQHDVGPAPDPRPTSSC